MGLTWKYNLKYSNLEKSENTSHCIKYIVHDNNIYADNIYISDLSEKDIQLGFDKCLRIDSNWIGDIIGVFNCINKNVYDPVIKIVLNDLKPCELMKLNNIIGFKDAIKMSKEKFNPLYGGMFVSSKIMYDKLNNLSKE